MSDNLKVNVTTTVTTRKTIELRGSDIVDLLNKKYPGYDFSYAMVGTWSVSFVGVFEETVTDGGVE